MRYQLFRIYKKRRIHHKILCKYNNKNKHLKSRLAKFKRLSQDRQINKELWLSQMKEFKIILKPIKALLKIKQQSYYKKPQKIFLLFRRANQINLLKLLILIIKTPLYRFNKKRMLMFRALLKFQKSKRFLFYQKNKKNKLKK